MSLTWAQWEFIILFSVRYLRLVVQTIAHWLYKPIPILQSPTLSHENVTIILPTISNHIEELREPLLSMIACNPHEIFIVTTESRCETLQIFVQSINEKNLYVLHVPVANKRLQVCQAIPLIKTSITVIVDDDVIWPRTILPWLMAPFEDQGIGAVGTSQRVRRIKNGTLAEKLYNWIGAGYIERRNFETSATHKIDGGTSCMSGRTVALRTPVLQSPDFLEGYAGETWGGKPLHADDDNFITRWLVFKGLKTWVQHNMACEIETTLENNIKLLYQCARWARSNWRSNLKSINEGHIWKQQPWCSYALHLTMFMNFAIVYDPFLIWKCYQSTSSFNKSAKAYYRAVFWIWLLITKNVKLIGLYKRNVWDISFLPVSIFFGYFHSFIKFYALVTLDKTGWGSR
ncbi:Hyaluronan synthase 2 [Lachnellula arida]|uniref:Hyaluronan synthase 2 n=1 Tax=Lachnellula arida TaxID=1316785 RepID=A0A8T9AYK1_9HELO|nr:Hyaluronan synthase 2 [Lachnellula arida]